MAFRHRELTSSEGFQNSAVSANLICMLSMLTWAAGFPAAEFLLETWDPLALIFARLVMVVVFLLPVWTLLDGPRAVLHARWGRGIVVGGIGFGAGTYLILLGQSLSDPVTVTIVAASMPVIATILEVMFDARKLRPLFVLGVSLAILGGLVAAGANITDGSAGTGALLALISVLFFAWGSRAAVKDFPELSVIGRTTLTLAGALVFVCALFIFARLLGFAPGTTAPVDAIQIGYLVIFALGAMALSQLLWIMSVGRLGIALAAVHMNAAPIYVMLIMVSLGGVWNWTQALGALLVGLGVVIAQMRQRRN